MNNPQTKPDARTRAENAFFNVEGEINSLRHMATLAADLAFSFVGRPESAPSTLTVDYDSFERLQFAVRQTQNMADDLAAAFKKEFEEEART